MLRGKIPHFRLTCVAQKRRCLSSLITNANDYQKICYGLGATSSFRVVSERASARWSREGRGKRRLLTFFLAPCSRVSFRVPLERDFSRYPLNMKRLVVGCYGFHCCKGWLHRHHNGSVDTSLPIPPKAFVKCWHLLWLSTSEQQQTKLLTVSFTNTLVYSQTRQFQSLLRDLSPVIRINYFVSL